MAKLSAAQFREKHARRLKQSTEDIRLGVERVTVAPTLLAANKKEKMRANINAAIDNGKWERGLKRVSLEDWKRKTIDKGIGRIAAGIDAAAAKVEDFAGKLLPYIDKQTDELKKMPDVTLEDSIARMTHFVRGMAKFQR